MKCGPQNSERKEGFHSKKMGPHMLYESRAHPWEAKTFLWLQPPPGFHTCWSGDLASRAASVENVAHPFEKGSILKSRKNLCLTDRTEDSDPPASLPPACWGPDGLRCTHVPAAAHRPTSHKSFFCKPPVTGGYVHMQVTRRGPKFLSLPWWAQLYASGIPHALHPQGI